MINRMSFGPVAGSLQILFLILFSVFADYDSTADGSVPKNSDRTVNGTDPSRNMLRDYYPVFQDIHVMIFIGFGFLMTFLKRYGFSAVGLNMMIASFCIQWSMLVGGFIYIIHHHSYRFPINIEGLINGDFSAAAVLITFGAVLGKTSPVQLLIIALLEIVFFKMNEFIGLDILKATDTGGSMYVHCFGAYFGIALARVIYDDTINYGKYEGAVYHSDLFAMIGSIFLWMYWPSFNGGLVDGDRQHRAVINTYLALVSCCITTFAVQNTICKYRKFDMVHVQNATLAGGVAVGTCADLMLRPGGAIGVGIVAAILSSVGYEFLLPKMGHMKMHDTCGVNNLHGMPGVLSGILGIIMAAVASESQYSYSLYQIYPGRAPHNGTELMQLQTRLPDLEQGEGRSAGVQAGYQAAALIMTFAVACITGALTGLIVNWNCLDIPEEAFDDDEWWNAPTDMPKPESVNIKDALINLGLSMSSNMTSTAINGDPEGSLPYERLRQDSVISANLDISSDPTVRLRQNSITKL